MNDGEYTDCGCGISTCTRYFTRYVDMSYNRLLYLATMRGYIRHTEMPTFEKVVYILIHNNNNNNNTHTTQ